MTLFSAAALFGTMLVLAAIPGPGVLAVVARSLSAGFTHGAATACGIMLGDYVFILLSVSGLAYVAEAMGTAFVLIKYLGAAYLIWLGLNLLRQAKTAAKDPDRIAAAAAASHRSNLLIGLGTTLGNPKAILFYLSFFPAFLRLDQIGAGEVAALLLIATLAVGGVMLGYAWLGARASATLRSSRAGRSFNLVGGSVLIGGGIALAARG